MSSFDDLYMDLILLYETKPLNHRSKFPRCMILEKHAAFFGNYRPFQTPNYPNYPLNTDGIGMAMGNGGFGFMQT